MSPDKIRYECPGCGINHPHRVMTDRAVGWFKCEKCDGEHFDPMVAKRNAIKSTKVVKELPGEAEEKRNKAEDVNELLKFVDNFTIVLKSRLSQKHLEGRRGWQELVQAEPENELEDPRDPPVPRVRKRLWSAYKKFIGFKVDAHNRGDEEVINQLLDFMAWGVLCWGWLDNRETEVTDEKRLVDCLRVATDCMDRINQSREHDASFTWEGIQKDLMQALGKLLEIRQEGE